MKYFTVLILILLFFGNGIRAQQKTEKQTAIDARKTINLYIQFAQRFEKCTTENAACSAMDAYVKEYNALWNQIGPLFNSYKLTDEYSDLQEKNKALYKEVEAAFLRLSDGIQNLQIKYQNSEKFDKAIERMKNEMKDN
jgi:hypothetical protein